MLDSIVTRICPTPRDKTIFFAQFKNLINQTVLNFQDTTQAYKKRNSIPKTVSLPEILDGLKQHYKAGLEMYIVEMAKRDRQLLERAVTVEQVLHWLKGVCAVMGPMFRTLPAHTLSMDEVKEKRKQVKRQLLQPSPNLLALPAPQHVVNNNTITNMFGNLTN